MARTTSHSRGATRFLCITCEVQSRQRYFMVHRSEMSHRSGIQCPRCGSRAVTRSKAGIKKQQMIGDLGQRIRDAIKEKHGN